MRRSESIHADAKTIRRHRVGEQLDEMIPGFVDLLLEREHSTRTGEPEHVPPFALPAVGIEAARLVPPHLGVDTRRRLLDEKELHVQDGARRRRHDDLPLPGELPFDIGGLTQHAAGGGLADRKSVVAAIEIPTCGEVPEGPSPTSRDEQPEQAPKTGHRRSGRWYVRRTTCRRAGTMPSHGDNGSVAAVRLDTQSSRARALLLALAVGWAGCGSDPRLRVDDSVLARISLENKLLLFDAENELDIAIDDRDQLTESLEQLERRLGTVAARRTRALEDAKLFDKKGEASQVEVSELRARAAEAELDHLRARRELSRVKLERQGGVIVVARARFELAKARLVRRNNVPGADDLDLEAFEAQVERYREKVADRDEEVAEAEARVSEREEAWSMAASQLRAASGGAYGSRWLD